MPLLLEDRSTEIEDDLEAMFAGPSRMKHYFPLDQIEMNFLYGTSMKALCGYVKNGPQQDPFGLPLCEACRDIYKNLTKNTDGPTE